MYIHELAKICLYDLLLNGLIILVPTIFKETFDASSQKVNVTGNYPVKSKYVRLSDVNPALDTLAPSIVPFGFKSYSLPWSGSVTSSFDTTNNQYVPHVPTLPIVTHQTGSDGEVDTSIHLGIAFDDSGS